MPFVNMNVGDVQEPKPVPAARYSLTIASAKWNDAQESKDKGANIDVSIGIDGHLDAPNIRVFLAQPRPKDDAAKTMFKKLQTKRFLTQFKIPFNDDGFNTDDFAGATAQGDVGLSEPDVETGAIYNRLKLDRLHGETGPQ